MDASVKFVTVHKPRDGSDGSMFIPGSLYRTVTGVAGSPVKVNVTVNGEMPVRKIRGGTVLFEFESGVAAWGCVLRGLVHMIVCCGSTKTDGGSLKVTLYVLFVTVPLQ